MSKEFTKTLSSALRDVQRGSRTSSELVEESLGLIEAHNANLASFATTFPAEARKTAADIDARGPDDDLPLRGIPIAVKDIITSDEGDTRAGSLAHDTRWPSGDAVVVQRLRSAGAVVVGKSATMEFALGTPDPGKPLPIPRNPWDVNRHTGGSSSGSGSSVAAGMVLGALGTDTGASIRMPAALCGITGLKPTYGRVPKSGTVPLAYSLDSIGPMARSAEDCARILEVISGHHESDPSSSRRPVPHYVDALSGELRGLRVGVDGLSKFSGPGQDPSVEPLFQAFVSSLEELGAKVVPIELPHYDVLNAVTILTLIIEASAFHIDGLRKRYVDYGAPTRLTLSQALLASGADYVQAQRVRRSVQNEVRRLFQDVDVVVSPTISRPAPLFAELPDFMGSWFEGQDLRFHTGYWNALGAPSLTVPMGFNRDGLPLAAQISGRPFDEEVVLRVGHAFQANTDWHLRHPALDDIDRKSIPVVDADVSVPDEDREFARSALAFHGIDSQGDLPSVALGVPSIKRLTDALHAFIAEHPEEVPAMVFEP